MRQTAGKTPLVWTGDENSLLLPWNGRFFLVYCSQPRAARPVISCSSRRMSSLQSDLALRIQSICYGLSSFAFGLTRNTEDRDDLLHETFLKAFRKRDSLHPKTDLKAWLYTIMRNTFISHYHRRSKHKMVSLSVHEESLSFVPFWGFSARNQGLSHLAVEDIKGAMNTLEEPYLKPLVMCMEGFCYKEIAERLSLPMGTVKSRIHLARKLLKERLGTHSY